jgi:hypothetical protein
LAISAEEEYIEETSIDPEYSGSIEVDRMSGGELLFFPTRGGNPSETISLVEAKLIVQREDLENLPFDNEDR